VSDTRESRSTRAMNERTESVPGPQLPLAGLHEGDGGWAGRVAGRVPRVVAYIRVSTEDQARGLSLESQRERVADAVAQRGWELAGVECDRASGKSTRRPAFQRAVAALDAGEYDAMMFVRLDRLSRSIKDFCLLVERARTKGWAIVSLEPDVDMTSPFGRMFAQLMVVFAELERSLIGERQKESIAARKRAGTYRPPPVLMSREVEERIAHLASEGFGARRIARQLELEGFRPPRASRWQPSTVQVAMRRLAA
jgi:DNA invertase Pin-like site-specific DNA recombinase